MSFSIMVVEDTATQMLRNISAHLKEKVHQGISDVCFEMVQYAQAIVPVRTGYLRSTIYFLGSAVDPLAFEFGAQAEYSAFVEFGTRFQAAQPFIRPAVEAHTSKLLDVCVKAVTEAVRE